MELLTCAEQVKISKLPEMVIGVLLSDERTFNNYYLGKLSAEQVELCNSIFSEAQRQNCDCIIEMHCENIIKRFIKNV